MRTSSIVFLFLVITITNAKINRVPADFAKIQTAINASTNGDTVVVYPGTYFENINYRGKNIVVTSRFYESHDLNYIYTTIINGSQYIHQDSASVVLFINHEDSSAVLQGFTITGGKGTAWPDEHSPGTYTEGGGIHSALASPKILYNFIVNNEAVFTRPGVVSGGGGGIRAGDGNPYIANNVIMNNRGKYGAGVVFNYTGGTFRNNIVAGNVGGQDFGGGGMWINGSGPKPKNLENNTIIGNQSLAEGGGVLFTDPSATAVVRNNIIWGNIGASNAQISLSGLAVTALSYNDIQGGLPGSNNLNVDPAFSDSMLFLKSGSPLIDAGDSALSFNDLNNGSTATFPSLGTKRNDIGAYGGPFAAMLPVPSNPKIILSANQTGFGKIKPDSAVKVSLVIYNGGTKTLRLDSIRFKSNVGNSLSVLKFPMNQISIASHDTISIQWHPTSTQSLADTLFFYHNDTSAISPFKVSLSGRAFQIEKVNTGVMYAGSGTADTAKFYSIDTSNASVIMNGKTGLSQFLSLRANPATNELVGLINSSAPQFARISSTTGESFLLPKLTITNPKGMAFRSDGALLVGTFSGTIYTVNLTTGAATSIGSNGLRVAGLAFNPVNGTLWMSVRATGTGKDNIYKVNPMTAAATLVGATGFGIPTKDITFDGQGRLFGVLDTTGSQSYLIRIDTTNGKGTLVGAMNVKGIETIELSSYFVTNVRPGEEKAPSYFTLGQNFPNPFNPSSTIVFSIPKQTHVTLRIYDMIGREVETLVNEVLMNGQYKVTFDASHLASGMYIYTMTSGVFAESKKLLLVK